MYTRTCDKCGKKINGPSRANVVTQFKDHVCQPGVTMPDTEKVQLIFLIPKTLKKKFRILCVENDTDMSAEIVKFIKAYVEQED